MGTSLTLLKLRYLETRRLSEGETGIALSLADASGFDFHGKTDSAQLQSWRFGLVLHMP